jgi:hypothetical protein
MVTFSDESNFEIINTKNKTFVRRKNTEKYLQQHLQSRIQKCISGSCVGCHEIYEGRLNRYGYRDILDNTLAPSCESRLAIRDAISQSSVVEELLKAFSKIVKKIKKSSPVLHLFNTIQANLNSESDENRIYMVLQNVKTRWNSDFYMVERLSQIRETIKGVIERTKDMPDISEES